MTKTTYIVFYVKDCQPHIKMFASKKQALLFAKLRDKEKDEFGDNWTDLVIKGTIIETFSGFSGIVRAK